MLCADNSTIRTGCQVATEPVTLRMIRSVTGAGDGGRLITTGHRRGLGGRCYP
ncbi:hypothetical protein [Streptomyces tubercidicus]|uniref:hypothetical protein n=1 Tax=Streptomyces tubercidicus TaxID=47759 RepID=UPI003466BC59